MIVFSEMEYLGRVDGVARVKLSGIVLQRRLKFLELFLSKLYGSPTLSGQGPVQQGPLCFWLAHVLFTRIIDDMNQLEFYIKLIRIS